MSEEAIYLGDSCYARFDGYHVILTTESHIITDANNVVYLDEQVMSKLVKWAKEIKIADDVECPMATSGDKNNG